MSWKEVLDEETLVDVWPRVFLARDEPTTEARTSSVVDLLLLALISMWMSSAGKAKYSTWWKRIIGYTVLFQAL